LNIHPLILKSLSKDNIKFINQVDHLLNNGNYSEAYNKICTVNFQSFDLSKKGNAYFLSELAGYLIDIGAEGDIKSSIEKGLSLIEQNQSPIREFVNEASMEYNLGNGKKCLFDVDRKNTKGYKYTPNSIALLTEAKNHYWRSFKLVEGNISDFKKQVLVNLANALSQSGRTPEALYYYNLVLDNDSGFPRANASKAIAIEWFSKISGNISINMLVSQKILYKNAIDSNEPSNQLINSWKIRIDEIEKELDKVGYNNESVEEDFTETYKESLTHSQFRNFCIENFIALSEHALYCNCIGAKSDDLTIPTSTFAIEGQYVPKMELYLNRIKSEFNLARYLFFQANNANYKDIDNINSEISFTELYENEEISLRSEMYRCSFRLCFGILDKIARGICDLYSLADKNEDIYFERFWKPRGKNLSEKQRTRWEKINGINNYPIIALYSIATDLNSKVGEWGEFKSWRDALEHEFLILTKDNDPKSSFSYETKNDSDYMTVDYHQFTTKTLHLLQLTCSAIFNFTFSVRNKGWNANKDEVDPITLYPKEFAV